MIERPLKNPIASDFQAPEEPFLPVSENTVIPEDQLVLDIASRNGRLKDIWLNIKYQATRREAELELIPFWKYFSASFALLSAITLFLFILVRILFRFNLLPSEILFFYKPDVSHFIQSDKIILILTAVGTLAVNLIVLRLVYQIFRYDRRLGDVICWVLGIINILLLIAMAEMGSLFFQYA